MANKLEGRGGGGVKALVAGPLKKPFFSRLPLKQIVNPALLYPWSSDPKKCIRLLRHEAAKTSVADPDLEKKLYWSLHKKGRKKSLDQIIFGLKKTDPNPTIKPRNRL